MTGTRRVASRLRLAPGERGDAWRTPVPRDELAAHAKDKEPGERRHGALGPLREA